MREQGYRIIPVNPNIREALGEDAYPSLLEVPDKIDIVNVFRRSEFLPEIAHQAISKRAKVLWCQLGVVDEKAAKEAIAAGLTVIMDRCPAIESARLF